MSKDIKNIKSSWNEHAKRYDAWYETFVGAVQNYVDWELLKGYLPKDKNAKILDAAGGTGRMTLPLAKMGYHVTLCDISPEMLNVAREKLNREGLLDRVEILECDVCKLRFADESFDLVLCWDGMFEAASELIRVLKKGGMLSLFLMNKCCDAITKFHEDPNAALALLGPKPTVVHHDDETHIAVSAEEAKEHFEGQGLRVKDVYAVCGFLQWLSIPEGVREAREWDETFFKQVTEMLLRLSKEPSTKGLSRHLVLYGEKMEA